MTVIDKLIVTLGLDPKDFNKGEKEYLESLRRMEKESKKSNKSMVKDTTNLSDAVGGMTRQVLGLATAFLSVGAARGFIKDITEKDAAIGRFAENINSTSEELSMWQGIVKRVGGDGNAVAKSFEGIARSLEQWQLYGTYPEAFKLFELNNISLIDRATGKQRTFTDLMIETSKVMEGMDKSRAREIGFGMGLDSDLINILTQGPEATIKFITEQRALVSEESARLAQERQDSEAKLIAALTELGRDVVNDLSPGIKAFNNTIAELLVEFRKITGGSPLKWLKKQFPIGASELGDGTLSGNMDKITESRASSSTLAALIRKLESGDNYGAINTDKSNVQDVKGLKDSFSKDYSSKSLNEIIAEEVSGQYQAAGAYQIRATTLMDAIRSMNLSGEEKFDKGMQDRIFNEFLFKRRMKDNKADSTKGLINEFDALKGRESEIMSLLSDVQQGNSTSNTTTIQIDQMTIASSAENTNELGRDIRNNVGRNFNLTTQANY